ncbi:unnamed protein product [Protopolystoma xenopodis]|uniref:Uncharacterized protein n=1 Tax=Protopolystoma xenopodis TaxID=117903 RepID=A0A448WH22_9PLAT|nr:unnamed protein product [Protopolystoma xenopodis]
MSLLTLTPSLDAGGMELCIEPDLNLLGRRMDHSGRKKSSEQRAQTRLVDSKFFDKKSRQDHVLGGSITAMEDQYRSKLTRQSSFKAYTIFHGASKEAAAHSLGITGLAPLMVHNILVSGFNFLSHIGKVLDQFQSAQTDSSSFQSPVHRVFCKKMPEASLIFSFLACSPYVASHSVALQ